MSVERKRSSFSIEEIIFESLHSYTPTKLIEDHGEARADVGVREVARDDVDPAHESAEAAAGERLRPFKDRIPHPKLQGRTNVAHEAGAIAT